MSTALSLLALLEQEPAHGYTLKHRYDALFARTRPLAFGQVYAALTRFDKHGWAEVSEVEVAEGPERKRFRITPAGVEAVNDWVYTAHEPSEFAASDLFARVSVALLSGRSADDVLDSQRLVHLARMRALTEQRRAADAAQLLSITYELTHLDADLRWIEEAGRRLGDAAAALRNSEETS